MTQVISRAVLMFGEFLTIVIIARALLTWLPIRKDGFLFVLLSSFTEPFVSPFRKLVQKSPISGMMIDISPLLALLMIRTLARLLSNVIYVL